MGNKITNSKYFVGILYPENMIENWEDIIDDVLELPFAYCVHDKDLDNDGDCRTIHVHCMIAFNNTSTIKHAMNILDGLSAPGKKCISTCQACISVRRSYNYLIHDTDKARKEGKYQYDKSERITGNCFDIGSYEQISITDKKNVCKELCNLIRDNMLTNFVDFYNLVIDSYDDPIYFDCLSSYSGLFERMTKGNFQKYVIKKRNLKNQEIYIESEIL